MLTCWPAATARARVSVTVLAAASTVTRLTSMRVPSTSTVKDSLVGAWSPFPSSGASGQRDHGVYVVLLGRGQPPAGGACPYALLGQVQGAGVGGGGRQPGGG